MAESTILQEVHGYAGTFEEAVELGLIEKPPPLVWNDWLQYRKITESVPSGMADNRAEGKLYARVQRHYYGEQYRSLAKAYNEEHPGWLDRLAAEQAAARRLAARALPEARAAPPGSVPTPTEAGALVGGEGAQVLPVHPPKLLDVKDSRRPAHVRLHT